MLDALKKPYVFAIKCVELVLLAPVEEAALAAGLEAKPAAGLGAFAVLATGWKAVIEPELEAEPVGVFTPMLTAGNPWDVSAP